MELSAQSRAGVKVLTPSGRIDHASADAFGQALAQHVEACKAGEPALVIDMNAVDYISSVGLRALMIAGKQVEAQQGRMVLAGLTPLVREVFEISRFDLLFEIFDTVDDALGAHGNGG